MSTIPNSPISINPIEVTLTPHQVETFAKIHKHIQTSLIQINTSPTGVGKMLMSDLIVINPTNLIQHWYKEAEK